jgi:hypothetical protein
MAKQQKQEVSEQDVEQAIDHAKRSLNARVSYDEKYQPKGFSKWGNDKCIFRTADAIEDMERNAASDRRIRYWKNH